MKYIRSYFCTSFLLLAMITGCSSFAPRHPVPIDQIDRVQILPGVPEIRALAGELSNQFQEDLIESVRQEIQASIEAGGTGTPYINVLTLSGGGNHGAFGAGFINGWTQSGTRPKFKFVTGVSTGALIAPFAFLGHEYDDRLQQGFTTIGADDIYKERGISALWSNSFSDSAPLKRLIKKYYDQDVFSAIAQAHREGRRLYIGTTHMDADRLVIWNMGAIANSGHPQALKLFRKIILASTSIPVTFSPVLIDVTADKVTYDEMHVDGGVSAQLFLTAATINITKIRQKLGLPKTSEEITKIYIIRNTTVEPQPESVSNKMNGIMQRAMSILIKSQARNDLFRIHQFAHENGFGFNWVALPIEYELLHAEPYDTAEMNRLYDIGFEMGLKGDAWRKEPPEIGQK